MGQASSNYDHMKEGEHTDVQPGQPPQQNAAQVVRNNKLYVLLRFIDWLSSLIVWASIRDKGRTNGGCWFGYEVHFQSPNDGPIYNEAACEYAEGFGILTWLLEFALLFALLIPACTKCRHPQCFTNVNAKIPIDLIWSFLWALLWFACSMNLSVMYTRTCTTVEDLGKACSSFNGHTTMLGVVFFSWVCCLLWLFNFLYHYQERQKAAQVPKPAPATSTPHGEAPSAPAAGVSVPPTPVSPGPAQNKALPTEQHLHEPLDTHTQDV